MAGNTNLTKNLDTQQILTIQKKGKQPMKRLPNETFEDYKKRRQESNQSTADYLKGQVVKPMPATPSILKAFRKIEKKFEHAAPLEKARLEKKGMKLAKKIDEMKK